MIEPPHIIAEPRITLENELEQRIVAIRKSREYVIDEEPEKQQMRIDVASYALEAFCTGFLLGLKERNK